MKYQLYKHRYILNSNPRAYTKKMCQKCMYLNSNLKNTLTETKPCNRQESNLFAAAIFISVMRMIVRRGLI